jgi:hypothetical protein
VRLLMVVKAEERAWERMVKAEKDLMHLRRMVLGHKTFLNHRAVSSRFKVISFECHYSRALRISMRENVSFFPVKNSLIFYCLPMFSNNACMACFFMLLAHTLRMYSILRAYRFLSFTIRTR